MAPDATPDRQRYENAFGRKLQHLPAPCVHWKVPGKFQESSRTHVEHEAVDRLRERSREGIRNEAPTGNFRTFNSKCHRNAEERENRVRYTDPQKKRHNHHIQKVPRVYINITAGRKPATCLPHGKNMRCRYATRKRANTFRDRLNALHLERAKVSYPVLFWNAM